MFRSRKTIRQKELAFEEVVVDTTSSCHFNAGRLEGKFELPLARRNIMIVAGLCVVISMLFLSKLFTLQVLHGAEYNALSINNTVFNNPIIAERGVLYDRNGEMIAWNEFDASGTYSFPVRTYTNRTGLGQLVGYVSYPARDKNGFYYDTEYTGISGSESTYNRILRGENGTQIVELNALQEVVAAHEIEAPQPGQPVHLSVDVKLSEAFYKLIATSSAQAGFRSGAGAIMDVKTGELVAMTSFPSYDPEVMADGNEIEIIESYNNDERLPFLNKVHAGVFIPGSVVKPFMAYAALEEGVISPEKEILSTGEIVVPNPYDPSNPARFTDWRAHGLVDIRKAIAFSSNVYFYYVSGGFKDQVGVGIDAMNEYFSLFGFGKPTGFTLANEQAGTVPSRAWKEEVFDEPWRLGNTYHTSIGQFGWQTTPLQMLVAYGALANGGTFFEPHLDKNTVGKYETKPLNKDSLDIIREGMRMAVNYNGGTARGLEKKEVAIAAKSGTAEVGVGNAYVNSWAAGYWPYEDPQYAFVLMMEHAPRSNRLGATNIMGTFVDWMAEHTPEYLEHVQKPTTKD